MIDTNDLYESEQRFRPVFAEDKKEKHWLMR